MNNPSYYQGCQFSVWSAHWGHLTNYQELAKFQKWEQGFRNFYNDFSKNIFICFVASDLSYGKRDL